MHARARDRGHVDDGALRRFELSDQAARQENGREEDGLQFKRERKGEEEITHVVVENPSKSLAFFLRLKVTKGVKGEEILPVLWEDNYISLLPGEKREVTATYRAAELGASKPSVEVSGWNVE